MNIVETLVYVGAEDCNELDYPAGTAFFDLGHGHVHSAYNPSETEETVFVATFFEATGGADTAAHPCPGARGVCAALSAPRDVPTG